MTFDRAEQSILEVPLGLRLHDTTKVLALTRPSVLGRARVD